MALTARRSKDNSWFQKQNHVRPAKNQVSKAFIDPALGTPGGGGGNETLGLTVGGTSTISGYQVGSYGDLNPNTIQGVEVNFFRANDTNNEITLRMDGNERLPGYDTITLRFGAPVNSEVDVTFGSSFYTGVNATIVAWMSSNIGQTIDVEIVVPQIADPEPPALLAGTSPLGGQWDARDAVAGGDGRLTDWINRRGTLERNNQAQWPQPDLSFPVEGINGRPAVKFDDTSTASGNVSNTMRFLTNTNLPKGVFLMAVTPIPALINGLSAGETMTFWGDTSANARAMHYFLDESRFAAIGQAYIDFDNTERQLVGSTLQADVAGMSILAFNTSIYNVDGFGATGRNIANTWQPCFCYIHEALFYEADVSNYNDLLPAIRYLNDKWGFGLIEPTATVDVAGFMPPTVGDNATFDVSIGSTTYQVPLIKDDGPIEVAILLHVLLETQWVPGRVSKIERNGTQLTFTGATDALLVYNQT